MALGSSDLLGRDGHLYSADIRFVRSLISPIAGQRDAQSFLKKVGSVLYHRRGEHHLTCIHDE
jgi:hypothetical protein